MRRELVEISEMKDPGLLGMEPDSLRPGDAILAVNGRPVSDQVDFYFFLPEEGRVRLGIRKRDGTLGEIATDAETIRALEIRFSPMGFKSCRCKCIFCFVDQTPRGMRNTLYVKDEDFRLSFLYGNFTTMNDVTEEELAKIVEQNLSPQYVSVHAVDRKLRETIFGRPMKRDILETLAALARGGIEIHTQAVLCPGLNDGEELDRTIEELSALHENIRSLAVVPVGLTAHREGLPRLRRYRRDESERILERVHEHQARFLSSDRRSRFVFASDEWYLDCSAELPAWEEYEGFPQLDNGVGMTREFERSVERELAEMGVPDDLSGIGLVTGRLGRTVLERYVLPLLGEAGAQGLPVLIEVPNRFFGEEVTVSGLLTGRDIALSLREAPPGKTYLIPPNCLDHDGAFLDDLDVDELGEISGREIAPVVDSFVDALRGFSESGSMDE